MKKKYIKFGSCIRTTQFSIGGGRSRYIQKKIADKISSNFLPRPRLVAG